MAEKKQAGRIKYFMNKTEYNSICNLMYYIAEELDAGRYTDFAKYMLKKLLRYNVIFGNLDSDDCLIRVCLYNNEAEVLLSIYTVYMNKVLEGSERITHDYIETLKKKKYKRR